MIEQWMKCESKIELSGKYYVDSICDAKDGLVITVSDSIHEELKMRIVFKDSVHAYRSTNESYRQKILSELEDKYGTEFYTDWTMFKVGNSEYLKWLSEQSFEISESESLTHFSIIAVDSIVDIIATYEPTLECFL